MEFGVEIESDCAPLNGLVAAMLEVTQEIHVLRDPARGGVASSLNEIARSSNVGIVYQENKLPVPDPVRSACDILGLGRSTSPTRVSCWRLFRKPWRKRCLPACVNTHLDKKPLSLATSPSNTPAWSSPAPASAASAWSICRSENSCRGFVRGGG